MNQIILVSPAKEHGDQVMEYKNEFINHAEKMAGVAGLQNAPSYAQWLSALCDNKKEETVREGLVPASTYLAIRENDGRIVGMIDIRHRLNDFLLQYGGHIGYSVRRSERRKGYAKEMLRQALTICRGLELTRVLITCDSENIASSKTIIACGGVLENEIPEEGRITQRYWINL